jgi:glutamate-1-semialdehyde 2,1-aminomutase
MDLLATAKKVMPGATLGIFSLPDNLRPVIVKGEGCKVTDHTGKTYIDYVLSSGPLLVGHAHPEVVEAVQKQAALGSSYYLLNKPAILLAEKIVNAVPCGESLRYQLGGSDATANAIRLARGKTGRKLVLKFQGGFHGWHDIAQHSIDATSNASSAVPESAGISESVTADIRIAQFNDINSVKKIISENNGQIAAIIVEPMQRVLLPSPGFLSSLREIANSEKIVLIFDEIVTGFRLAWGGGQEAFSVVPDLACYGKVIGGGYPISAVVGSEELLAQADPTRKGSDNYCYMGGTLTGNPVAAAAGLATLEILERKDVYPTLYNLAAQLHAGLEEVGRYYGFTLNVSGMGPVLQVFFTESQKKNSSVNVQNVDKYLSKIFAYEMIARGILISPASKIYISLAHTSADIAKTISVAGDALAAIARSRFETDRRKI